MGHSRNQEADGSAGGGGLKKMLRSMSSSLERQSSIGKKSIGSKLHDKLGSRKALPFSVVISEIQADLPSSALQHGLPLVVLWSRGDTEVLSSPAGRKVATSPKTVEVTWQDWLQQTITLSLVGSSFKPKECRFKVQQGHLPGTAQPQSDGATAATAAAPHSPGTTGDGLRTVAKSGNLDLSQYCSEIGLSREELISIPLTPAGKLKLLITTAPTLDPARDASVTGHAATRGSIFSTSVTGSEGFVGRECSTGTAPAQRASNSGAATPSGRSDRSEKVSLNPFAKRKGGHRQAASEASPVPAVGQLRSHHIGQSNTPTTVHESDEDVGDALASAAAASASIAAGSTSASPAQHAAVAALRERRDSSNGGASDGTAAESVPSPAGRRHSNSGWASWLGFGRGSGPGTGSGAGSAGGGAGAAGAAGAHASVHGSSSNGGVMTKEAVADSLQVSSTLHESDDPSQLRAIALDLLRQRDEWRARALQAQDALGHARTDRSAAKREAQRLELRLREHQEQVGRQADGSLVSELVEAKVRMAELQEENLKLRRLAKFVGPAFFDGGSEGGESAEEAAGR